MIYATGKLESLSEGDPQQRKPHGGHVRGERATSRQRQPSKQTVRGRGSHTRAIRVHSRSGANGLPRRVLTMSTHGRLLASLAVLFAVYVCGTIGFVVIEGDAGVTIADAAYMTAITLSTVGFREVVPLSDAGRVWTVLVIVFGVATVSFAFSSLNTLFISGEIRAMRERRRMQSEIEKMHDHVILCGYGRMGALTVA